MPAYQARSKSDNRRTRKGDRNSTFVKNRNMAKLARKATRLERKANG